MAFSPGSYHVGDYWLIPARTATHDVEWPRDGKNPLPQLPHGILHRYCRLAVLDFADGTWTPGARLPQALPAADGDDPLCLRRRGMGRNVSGQALPWPLQVGVLNGQIPVAGAVVEFSVASGGGRLQARNPGSPACSNFVKGGKASVQVVTGEDGLAARCWRPGTGTWQQQVEARLLEIDGKPLVDASGKPLLTPIIFSANLSLASQVSYGAVTA